MWVCIGLLYYVLCCFVLYRLLATAPTTLVRSAAVACLVAVMLANAGWGYLFSRRKDFRASFLGFIPYGLLVLTLAVLLVRLDPPAAWALSPYVAYLGYATWWGNRVWRLNQGSIQRRATHADRSGTSS